MTPAPLPASVGFERVEGMLLGLAIGDALGATTEAMLPGERAARYGEIVDYLPDRYAGGKAADCPQTTPSSPSGPWNRCCATALSGPIKSLADLRTRESSGSEARLPPLCATSTTELRGTKPASRPPATER